MKIKSILLAFVLLMSGCATLDSEPEPGDPFESFNRSMHSFNSTVDDYVLKPTAQGYDAITPPVVKKGVSNVFSNLDDVIVVVNDLLQLKIGQFFSDLGRLAINSTIGLYGLIDVASEMGLEKHDEDFGQTLGHWGVPRGPYLVLPFLGPSTVRDGSGKFLVDNKIDPIFYEVHEGTPLPSRDESSSYLLFATDTINFRAQLLKSERIAKEAMFEDDDYYFIRDAFLQRRNNLVFDGDPPKEDWEYYEEE